MCLRWRGGGGGAVDMYTYRRQGAYTTHTPAASQPAYLPHLYMPHSDQMRRARGRATRETRGTNTEDTPEGIYPIPHTLHLEGYPTPTSGDRGRVCPETGPRGISPRSPARAPPRRYTPRDSPPEIYPSGDIPLRRLVPETGPRILVPDPPPGTAPTRHRHRPPPPSPAPAPDNPPRTGPPPRLPPRPRRGTIPPYSTNPPVR